MGIPSVGSRAFPVFLSLGWCCELYRFLFVPWSFILGVMDMAPMFFGILTEVASRAGDGFYVGIGVAQRLGLRVGSKMA